MRGNFVATVFVCWGILAGVIAEGPTERAPERKMDSCHGVYTVQNWNESMAVFYCDVTPTICGQPRTCLPSINGQGGGCPLRGHYLQHLSWTEDTSIDTLCCRLSPDIRDEDCYDVRIVGQAHEGMEGGLFRGPRDTAARRPTNPLRTTPRSPLSTRRPSHWIEHDNLALYTYNSSQHRVSDELIKGVYREGKGAAYRIRVCKPKCHSSTTRLTTRKATTIKPNPTRGATAEHGCPGNDSPDMHGRTCTSLDPVYCQTDASEMCRKQCRARSGVRFIKAECKSESSSSLHHGEGSHSSGHSPRRCICLENKEVKHDEQKPPERKGPLGRRLVDGGRHGCFSGDMLVTTPDGSRRMDELHVGDRVLVLSAESDHRFQPIEWFYHRDPDQLMEFITLKTRSGRVLSLTPNHLLPLFPCFPSKNLSLIEMDTLMATSTRFASRAKPGLCVATKSATDDVQFQSDPIVEVSRSRGRGIFSPITSHGTLVVNGVQVSCYSSLENHWVQRTILSVLIEVDRVARWIWKGTGRLEEKEIPKVLLFLLELAKSVLPSYVYT